MRGSGIPRLLIVGALVSVVACSGPTASTTPAPSGSTTSPTAAPPTALATTEPTALPSPTAAPTPTVQPSPGVSTYRPLGLTYANTFVMRVAVNDLNVRSKPAKSGASMGKVDKGWLFMVYDWPIVADGYTWYYGYQQLEDNNRVPPLPTPYNEGYDGIVAGWMAAGTSDAPFLVPVGARCPTVPDIATLLAMLGSEKIDCFGSDTINLQGTYRKADAEGETPGTFTPAWLAAYGVFDRLWTADDGDYIELQFPPDVAMPTDGTNIRVQGHFSDSRSTTCRLTLQGESIGDGKVDNAAAEQWCRARFVVDSFSVIP